MVHNDTIELLKECNSGIKMGVASIDEVMPKTKDNNLEQLLSTSKSEHEKLGAETRNLLNNFGDSDKEPNPIAKSMSWLKTNVMLTVDQSDDTIADIVTDGCNMGVKSLNKYLNRYEQADENAKDITKRLIGLEEKLSVNLRSFL